MNIKRIIARDRLILISIAFFLGLLFLIPASIVLKGTRSEINLLKDTKSKIDLLSAKQIEVYDSKSHLTYTFLVNKKYFETNYEDASYTPEALIGQLGRRGMLTKKIREGLVDESKNIYAISKKVINTTPVTGALFLICLFIYPFYLLIRFIVWSVRTFKEGKT